MTTIRPTGDRVVIEPLKPEEKTASGLVIPTTAQTTPQEAMVLAIGKDVVDLKVGDRVIYSMYGGTKIDYDNKSLLVIDEKDIICVVE